MKKYSTPDVIISGKTVDGHRVLKLNSYASEILDALKSGKSEEETALLLIEKYGLSNAEAEENINLILSVLRGENDGIKIIINGMVTARTVARVFADTSIDNSKINKVPTYPPTITSRYS